MTKKIRTAKEKLLLRVSLGGGLGILPFAIFRLSVSQWAIGIMDLVTSLGMIVLFLYVLKTQKTTFASKILSVLALVAMIFTVHLKGAQQVYWAYPGIVSFYYLLKPRTALIFTLITVTLIFPVLYQQTNLLTLGAILVPLLITISFAYILAIEINFQHNLLIKQATKDPLTGAGNRRALAEKIQQLIALFQRSGNKVTMLLIDIDHFKKINDKFGHNTGDRFLTGITEILKSRIRISDSLYRFGGEEFIVLAENTDIAAAQVLAEELRTAVENNKIIPEAGVTISIGVAELKLKETDEQWLKRADDALYEVKESGRNKVYIAR